MSIYFMILEGNVLSYFKLQIIKMNKNILLLLCLLIIPSLGLSLERYIDEIFDEVIITEDVVYGNAPDLPFIFLFEWNT